MFMQRLITSLILVPLVVLILFFAPTWVLVPLMIAVILIAGKECWQLIPLEGWVLKTGFLLLLLGAVALCGYWFAYWQILGMVVWLLLCLAIVTYPKSQAYWGNPLVVASLCLFLLPLFAQAMFQIYTLTQGKSLILYLFFLVWAADVGAYFLGKLCGKHKLIPQVSPGKSWEGLAGGLMLSMVIASIAYLYYLPNSMILWFALALVVVLISIFGDLFVSILKRRCHLKDTGVIIPGHGGVLDRLDSLIAAAPVFHFGLTYMPLSL